jgi:hypothetical protein
VLCLFLCTSLPQRCYLLTFSKANSLTTPPTALLSFVRRRTCGVSLATLLLQPFDSHDCGQDASAAAPRSERRPELVLYGKLLHLSVWKTRLVSFSRRAPRVGHCRPSERLPPSSPMIARRTASQKDRPHPLFCDHLLIVTVTRPCTSGMSEFGMSEFVQPN